MSSWSRSRYQGSCRDDDSLSSHQAGLRAHCTVCGGMLTHTDICCCWSAHFRGCCCHSIAGSISPVTECHVCGPGHWCAATAWPGCLRCSPRPHWPPAQPAPAPAWPAPAQFLQIFIQSCVCLHTDNTQLCPVCVCGDCGVFGVCMESCPSLHPGIVCYLCQYRGGQCGLGSTQETRNYSL